MWALGRSGIDENERADALAQKAEICSNTYPRPFRGKSLQK